MSKKLVKLHNTVYWNHADDRKDYMSGVNIAVTNLWPYSRQVSVRFVDGPAMDLPIDDMDRLVKEYLKQRAKLIAKRACKRRGIVVRDKKQIVVR